MGRNVIYWFIRTGAHPEPKADVPNRFIRLKIDMRFLRFTLHLVYIG